MSDYLDIELRAAGEIAVRVLLEPLNDDERILKLSELIVVALTSSSDHVQKTVRRFVTYQCAAVRDAIPSSISVDTGFMLLRETYRKLPSSHFDARVKLVTTVLDFWRDSEGDEKQNRVRLFSFIVHCFKSDLNLSSKIVAHLQNPDFNVAPQVLEEAILLICSEHEREAWKVSELARTLLYLAVDELLRPSTGFSQHLQRQLDQAVPGPFDKVLGLFETLAKGRAIVEAV